MISHAACSFILLLKINGVVLCRGIIVMFLLEEMVFSVSGGLGMVSDCMDFTF